MDFSKLKRVVVAHARTYENIGKANFAFYKIFKTVSSIEGKVILKRII